MNQICCLYPGTFLELATQGWRWPKELLELFGGYVVPFELHYKINALLDVTTVGRLKVRQLFELIGIRKFVGSNNSCFHVYEYRHYPDR